MARQKVKNQNKNRRYKPNTKALRALNKELKAIDLILPKTAIKNIMKDIAMDHIGQSFRIAPEALTLTRFIMQEKICRIFSCAEPIRRVSNTTILLLRQFRAAKEVSDIANAGQRAYYFPLKKNKQMRKNPFKSKHNGSHNPKLSQEIREAKKKLMNIDKVIKQVDDAIEKRLTF